MRVRYKFLFLFIIVAGAAAIMINLGLFEEEDAAPSDISEQIEALGNDRYEITKVRDDGNMYKVWINFKTQLGSNSAAKVYTDSVRDNTRSILMEADIERDIAVYGSQKLIQGRSIEYGTSYYYQSSDTYLFIAKENEPEPPGITEQIQALAKAYYSISRIEPSGDLYEIWIDLKTDPGSASVVKIYTDSVYEDVRSILENEDAESDIIVHGIRTGTGGKVTEYGATYYYLSSDEYEFIE